jgi:hypothetical protein
MLVIVKIAGSAHAYPKPRKPKSPADKVAAFFNVLWKKLVYTALTALCQVLVDVPFPASSIGGFGLGQSNYLF